MFTFMNRDKHSSNIWSVELYSNNEIMQCNYFVINKLSGKCYNITRVKWWQISEIQEFERSDIITKISAIEEKDLRTCAEIYADVFNSEPWNDNWSIETAYNRLRDIYVSPKFIGVMYTNNGVIKGAAFGNCEQWYEGMHLNVKEMFVSSELQGQGIGTLLLNEIESEAKKTDVRTIILFTEKNCKTDDFYKKNGFSELDFMSMLEKNI